MMKNMKKMKGVSVESSVYGVGDGGEAKMRFKHQSLLQDFAELEKVRSIWVLLFSWLM